MSRRSCNLESYVTHPKSPLRHHTWFQNMTVNFGIYKICKKGMKIRNQWLGHFRIKKNCFTRLLGRRMYQSSICFRLLTRPESTQMTKNMLRSSTTWVYCNSERFSKVTRILLLLNNGKCSIRYESIGERMLLYISTTVQCTMNTPEGHPTSIIQLVGESSRP